MACFVFITMIVELLNEYDLVKEFGEGVDRIYRDMAEAGLPEPEYRQSEFMLYATLKNKNWGKEDASWTREEQVREQDREQVGEQDEISRLIDFCSIPRSRSEMMEFLGLSGRRSFSDHYLKPLLATGKLSMTIPDKPNSKNQKYVAIK